MDGARGSLCAAQAASAGAYLVAVAVIAGGFYLVQRCQVWKLRPQCFGTRRVPVQSLTVLT